MKKYLLFFNNYFQTEIEYRINLIGTILREIITLGSLIIFWVAIYSSSNDPLKLSLQDTILYYICVPLIGFITQVNISTSLGYEIKDGTLSNYLVKPFKIWISSFLKVLAGKIHTFLLVFPIYGVLLISIQVRYGFGYSLKSMVVGLFFAAIGFLVHFVLDISISWLAFWSDDVWSFKHFKNILFSFLGGVAFPFNFVTGTLRGILEVFPFKFFYFIPISYFIGERNINKYILKDLSETVFWLILFVFLSLVLWKFGIRKYEAYGK